MIVSLLAGMAASLWCVAPRHAKAAKEVTVAIDPGHQGRGNSATEPIGPGARTRKPKVSSGTTGKYTGVPEYKLNLTVAKQLRRELTRRGYTVVMTRTKHNVNISNRERAELANKSGADFCVRIHANGSTSSSTNGALTLYPGASNPYVSHLSAKSKRLSSRILSAMCKATGAKNLGTRVDDNLTGSNWSKLPVTVVEMGFMSNAREDRLMQTPSYQKKMVQGMANGIDRYAQGKK